MKTSLISTILLILLCVTIAEAENAGREVRPLNSSWEFTKKGSEQALISGNADWEKVNIPHTWNNKDMQSGPNFYAGTGWYRKVLQIEPELKEKRIFLRFEGVGQVADVFVNGQLVGTHQGAYAAFCFEITKSVKFGEQNTIIVKANNEARKDIIPVNHFLFGIFGGIYRPVSLIITDKINITPTDYASPGVYIRQKNVSEKSAEITVTTKIQSDYATKQNIVLKTTVYDKTGKSIATESSDISASPGNMFTASQNLRIVKPNLWNGLKNPYLYKLKTEIIFQGKTIDAVTQPLGLRFFNINPNTGFYLNGKPYRLFGTTRHQDWQNFGSALSNEQHKTDLDIIHEMGATSIRLAHYQQAEFVYSYSDEIGFLIWAEIPFVNAWTGQESANAKQQLIELIRQNYNHPSIFVWGLHNEVYAKNPYDTPVTLTRELHEIAKTEDPDRYDVAVGAYSDLNKPTNFLADLQGINRYLGWYEDKIEDLEPWIKMTKRERPDNLFSISEYGAEANISQQSEALVLKVDPVNGQFYPENFQTHFHEIQWSMIERNPYIWSSYIWNTFDFAVPMWNRGGVRARNMKGLVTYDRKVKKDAFYWYKANWSPEPVLYITERRLKERTKPATKITVYSNLESFEVTLNGKPLPAPEKGLTKVHYIWQNVALQKGENIVKASGIKNGKRITDEVNWILK